MNVLSLFDGMSCGQIALNRVGIKYENYFASEIDKYAIQIAKKNYPETIHIGSVIDVKPENLPKIDLLIGGSPCQGFSFAGKQLNFEDHRSRLFFEYVRLLKEINPKYFLLENVKMKKEYQNIISDYLGVEPIEINSSLVSAQNRKRLYWTNIPGNEKGLFDTKVSQPINLGIKLQDIIGQDFILVHNIYGGFKENKCRTFSKKAPTLRTAAGGGHIPSVFKGTVEEANKMNLSDLRNSIRALTSEEAEELQTVPTHYTQGVSNRQRMNMLGNGWTVDVICHILKGLV